VFRLSKEAGLSFGDASRLHASPLSASAAASAAAAAAIGGSGEGRPMRRHLVGSRRWADQQSRIVARPQNSTAACRQPLASSSSRR